MRAAPGVVVALALAVSAGVPVAGASAAGFFDVDLPATLAGALVARAPGAALAVEGPPGALSLTAAGLELTVAAQTKTYARDPVTGVPLLGYYGPIERSSRSFADATLRLVRAGPDAVVVAAAHGATVVETVGDDRDATLAGRADGVYPDPGRTDLREGEVLRPELAVRGAHLALESAAGAHVVRGNFTIVLWDIDVEIASGAGDVARVETGHREPAAAAAGQQRLANATLVVTDGVLTLGGAEAVLLAPAIEVAVEGVASFPSATGGVADGEARYEARGVPLSVRGDVLLAFTLVAGASDRALVALDGTVDSLTLAPAPRLDRDAFLGRAPAAAAAVTGGALLLAATVLVARHRDRIVARVRPARPASLAVTVETAAEALERGDDEEAVAHYDLALAARPTDVALLVGRGAALERLGRIEEARLAYERAVRADPARGEAHYYYARALAQLGLAASALPHLQRAVALDESLREMARDDAGFRSVADHPTFAALV